MDPSETQNTPHPMETTTLASVAGFSPGIGHYVAQLNETRAELLSQIGELTPEQLSWHPNDQTESIGTQLLHVAAVEWSWIFEDVFGQPETDYHGWEEAFPLRVGAPQVTGRPLAYYTDRLRRVRDEALTALQGLTDADLPRLIKEGAPVAPPWRLFSVDWILFHLVHHEAHHAGQVELLVRLLPTR